MMLIIIMKHDFLKNLTFNNSSTLLHMMLNIQCIGFTLNLANREINITIVITRKHKVE